MWERSNNYNPKHRPDNTDLNCNHQTLWYAGQDGRQGLWQGEMMESGNIGDGSWQVLKYA